MSIARKTATIQVRVLPIVKAASEAVLQRLGLSMSDAVELFLRRIIVDERIPFDIVALSQFQMSGFTGDRAHGHPLTGRTDDLVAEQRQLNSKSDKKGEPPKKKFKKIFLAPRTSSQIRAKARSKSGKSNHTRATCQNMA